MLNITNPQGNANQHNNEILLHMYQYGIYIYIYLYKQHHVTCFGTLVHCWGGCAMVQCCGKTGSLEIKNKTTYDSTILPVGNYPKDLNQDLKEVFALPCSLQH